MKIRHHGWHEVDGVEPMFLENGEHAGEWTLRQQDRTIHYNKLDGWEEVKEPRYVDVTGECSVQAAYSPYVWDVKVRGKLATNDKYHFRQKQWFDLPENLMFEIYHMTPKGFVDYVQRYKKPCLIVEKEEQP